METIVSDSATLPGMAKRKTEKTVPIHARIAESDVAEIDRVASTHPIPLTRSHMIALIVREWVNRHRSPKKK